MNLDSGFGGYFWGVESGEKKPIKKNHIKEFGGRDAPEVPQGTNSGRPRDTWDIWA